MSVVVPLRFVVQFWAPIIEKCGKVGGEDDDEQAQIKMQHAAIVAIRHLDGTIRRVQT
jgi:hypothetical protein